MSPAWVYYQGARAGLTRRETETLPLGRVLDQIACYQIAECGAKEKRGRAGRPGGEDLFETMRRL